MKVSNIKYGTRTNGNSFVSFELHNANVFANTIRRIMLGELPVQRLYVDEENIRCTDRTFTNDGIAKRINLLEVSQDPNENSQFELHVKNEQPSVLRVYSSSITPKRGCKSCYIDPNICIVELLPSHSIDISDITLKEGFGRHNASYSIITGWKYKEIDHDMVHTLTAKGNIIQRNVNNKHAKSGDIIIPDGIKTKEDLSRFNNIIEKDVPIALTTLAPQRSYALEFETEHADPKKMVLLACHVGLTTLNDILEMKNVDIVELSDVTQITIPYNETYGLLIQHEILELGGSSVPQKKHPYDEHMTLKISSDQATEVFIDGVKSAINKFEVLEKSFLQK